MCTALSWQAKDHYFGRNLDLDCSYGEEVAVLPRNLPLIFRTKQPMQKHYAIMGVATVMAGTALLYDGVNEYGLAMAGLNFPGNAYYGPQEKDKDNITPFEFIPWILGQCETVAQARTLLERINLVNIPFSEKLPLSPLHWMISDRQESLVVESMADGLHIHDNPVGVMTNNPPFEYHLFHLNNFRTLQTSTPQTDFSHNLGLNAYSNGMGALGLPGDVSSMSRFVRMVFGKENAICDGSETQAVSQFFHLLGSVEVSRGICLNPQGRVHFTVYSSCINTDKGLYYYTTYDNQQISCVDMHHCDLEGRQLYSFPLVTEQQVFCQN